MAWSTLSYSPEQVDAAGRTLIQKRATEQERAHSLVVINNWRAAHAFPLNTFQMYLRDKAKREDALALIAQRIKRLASIEQKLRRMRRLRLSEMQDIGGCRAVVSSVQQVNAVVKEYNESRIKHKRIDEDDYILKPKSSGYRSHHLIYEYYSDKNDRYNGRRIEVQIRSRLQHAWATAVETVGTFTSQALKSSQGEEDWLRFFALMGTVLAFKEGTPCVPGTPTEEGLLLAELQSYEARLQVNDKLSMYGAALRTLGSQETRRVHFYMLALDPGAGTVNVKGYRFSDIDAAMKEYATTEQEIRSKPGGEAVLVSVDSIESLRTAYPNYFLDTAIFRDELALALRPRQLPLPDVGEQHKTCY